MGYRSEVKYVLLFNNKESLDTFKVHAALTMSDDLKNLSTDILEAYENLSHSPNMQFPYRIYVTWDDVKWYESFKWVQVQDELMKFVGTMDKCGYAFARVGEETGDIEQHSSESVNMWDFIDVRTIVEWI